MENIHYLHVIYIDYAFSCCLMIGMSTVVTSHMNTYYMSQLCVPIISPGHDCYILL
jgi:hypothetical protein